MSISNLNPFRLTKLYSDAKVSANNVANAELQTFAAAATTDGPEFQALQRKFRIQKDRLVTWGLQWSDESKANPSIDESIARAGLTENVDGVMKNIAGILEDVERMGASSPTAKVASESLTKIGSFPGGIANASRELSAAELKKSEDLCKDLSSCIDVLYELSRSRRAILEGTYHVVGTSPANTNVAPEKTTLPPPISKGIFSNRSYSSSGETLVMPSRVSTEKTVAAQDLPPQLNRKDLVLPQEPPPAYGSQGNHAIRMIGHLRRSSPTSTYYSSAGRKQDVQPVMVEYSSFDPTYRETGVRLPPLEKLDALLNYFAKCNTLQDPSGSGTLFCAGWFEDLDFSRYGIVYELPKPLDRSGNETRPRDLRPLSLLSILQTSARSSSSTAIGARSSSMPVPPLESRFRLAQNLVRAFQRLHEESVLHRDVNSNNVVFFTKGPRGASSSSDSNIADSYELSAPHVCAFDLFSEYNVSSDGDGKPSNIYLHPDAASKPTQYSAEFDAYSLGLMLLEIGLWIPISELHKPKYSLSDFKRRIDSIWCKKLAAKCGTLYMKVVQDLLGIASHRRVAATNTAKPQLRQVYTRSLDRLRRLCLIDEAEPVDTPVSDSMRNSTLAAMVEQGVTFDPNQEIDRWTEKTQLYAEPSTAVEAAQVPSLNLGMVCEPLVSRFDGMSRTGSVSDHQPHTLPVAIEEGNEDALSRHGSNASNVRGAMSPRWSFGLGSPRQRDDADNISQHSISSRYRSAAQTIQRAWRSRGVIPSFQEYKRKITFIQQTWRKRRSSKQNSSAEPSETGNSSFYTSTEYLSSQRLGQQSIQESTSIQISPQTQPPRKKLRIQPVKLPRAQIDEWHSNLLPRLEKLLARALKDSPETASIDLLCVGDTPAKARPTIFVTCTSTARVKTVLSRRFSYNRDVYDLKVRRGAIKRSKSNDAKRRIREAHRSMATPNETDLQAGEGSSDVPLNPYHQKRPLCGASIGAYVDGQHLPPVSYGGVVAVDAGDGPELYGMTVHHLLDPPSEGEEGGDGEDESGFFDDDDEEQSSPGAARSSAGAAANSWLAGMGNAPGLGIDDAIPQSMYLEISDDSSVNSDANAPDLDWSSDEEDDASAADSHASTEGDLNGVSPFAVIDDCVYVTQPAIDDVDSEFFPCESDKDEDHFASHKLGQVYASSGIRRWRRNGTIHEIDWALLKLDEDRMQPVNVVQGGRKYLHKLGHNSPLMDDGVSHKPEDSGIDTSSGNPLLEAVSMNRKTLRPKLLEPVSRSPSFDAAEDEYPTSIVPADNLGSLRVHCLGRTSGLKDGIIGDAMSSVRLYGRKSPSRSWHVLGGFGMGGDSGAWILDNDSGRVCGHVLAFAERNSLAYICPLEVMFEDILRVLDAKSISLPGGEEAVVRSDIISRRGTLETNASAGAERMDDEDDLHFQMNGLGIDDVDSDDRSGGVVLRSSPVRARRAASRGREHDRDRLMYAPGGVLSMPQEGSFVTV